MGIESTSYDKSQEEQKYKEFKKHDYIKLKKIFKQLDPDRIEHIIWDLDRYYGREYRDERRNIKGTIGEYIKSNQEYLERAKKRIKKELELEKLSYKKKVRVLGTFALMGYGIGIPLMIAFPILAPVIDKFIVGAITEESVRRIVNGRKKKKAIEKEMEYIDNIETKYIAYALENVSYHQDETWNELLDLKIYKERNKHRFRKTTRKVLEPLYHKFCNRLPKKIEKYDQYFLYIPYEKINETKKKNYFR